MQSSHDQQSQWIAQATEPYVLGMCRAKKTESSIESYASLSWKALLTFQSSTQSSSSQPHACIPGWC